jgi:hypothetical protein
MEARYREVKRTRVAADAGADSCVSNGDSAMQLGLEIAAATAVPMPETTVPRKGWKRLCPCCREASGRDRDRLNYVRKVYLILLTQLSLTVLWVGITMVSPSLHSFVYTRLWLFLIFLSGILIILTILTCVPKLLHRVPWNYVILFLFVSANQTMATAYMVSYVTTRLSSEAVIAAGGMTGAVFVSLTLYVWFTPVFNKKRATLCGIAGSVIGLILIFVLLTHNALTVCFCFIMSSVICFYLVLAIGAIIDRDGIPLDNYIAGALLLYTVRNR